MFQENLIYIQNYENKYITKKISFAAIFQIKRFGLIANILK